MSAWRPIDSAPENVVIETMISDANGQRNEAALIRQGRLWFLLDKSMYVYYAPTHWREVTKP